MSKKKIIEFLDKLLINHKDKLEQMLKNLDEEQLEYVQGEIIDNITTRYLTLNPLDLMDTEQEFLEWININLDEYKEGVWNKKEIINILQVLITTLEKREEYERCALVVKEINKINENII